MNTTPTQVLCVKTNDTLDYCLSGTSLPSPAFDSSNSTVYIATVPRWFADEIKSALPAPLSFNSREELDKYLAEWPVYKDGYDAGLAAAILQPHTK